MLFCDKTNGCASYSLQFDKTNADAIFLTKVIAVVAIIAIRIQEPYLHISDGMKTGFQPL
ncbi:MAG TPA: hypothetical protein DD376_04890 [Sutterella sp.]|nr:hypothetical protein [Sutterella sp.]